MKERERNDDRERWRRKNQLLIRKDCRGQIRLLFTEKCKCVSVLRDGWMNAKGHDRW
jgi:hypothetical protein